MLPPLGLGSTFTDTVPVSCRTQPVAVTVANMLNVVFTLRLPVGRVMVAPVPDTAVPTLLLSALLRSWYVTPDWELVSCILALVPTQIRLLAALNVLSSGKGLTVMLTLPVMVRSQPDVWLLATTV